jgi:hypothetical protein
MARDYVELYERLVAERGSAELPAAFAVGAPDVADSSDAESHAVERRGAANPT